MPLYLSVSAVTMHCTVICDRGDEPSPSYLVCSQQHTQDLSDEGLSVEVETRPVSSEQCVKLKERILAFCQEVLKVVHTESEIDTKLESILVVVHCRQLFLPLKKLKESVLCELLLS